MTQRSINNRERAIEFLKGLYVCGRDWSAWQYGTMTQDDFAPANEFVAFVDQLESLLNNANKPQ